ncbi:diphthine synthase [Halorubrum trueperi]
MRDRDEMLRSGAECAFRALLDAAPPTVGMLTFIGLGLYDERSVTVEGREALRAADRVFAEFYTSKLVGADVNDLEAYHDVDVEVRAREGVERDPEPILAAAEDGDAAFCTAGDTMISTTHADLRLRAEERGIDTRVIHGVTAQSAASSLTGLQNYRFGKATTLPFPYAHGGDGVPQSVIETIEANRERGLHTVVYLDIKVGTGPTGPDPDHEEYMTADVAAALLADGWADELAVVIARAGSPDAVVAADRLSALADREFGEPLHLLVIPGDLHHVEADALAGLAGAPRDLVGE